MSMAKTLEAYLNHNGIYFDIVEHDYSEGSYNTVRIAQVDSLKLVKAVLFRDEDFHYTMCLLPAQNKVRRHTLNEIFDRHLEIVPEDELDDVFFDCEHGAVPAIGQAYGLNVIWDDELQQADHLYIEAGDHTHLIKISQGQFSKLMEGTMHDHFSTTKTTLVHHIQ